MNCVTKGIGVLCGNISAKGRLNTDLREQLQQQQVDGRRRNFPSREAGCGFNFLI